MVNDNGLSNVLVGGGLQRRRDGGVWRRLAEVRARALPWAAIRCGGVPDSIHLPAELHEFQAGMT